MANPASNFISGMKGAFLAETPGVTYTMQAIKSLSDKGFAKTAKDTAKAQQTSNVMSRDMVMKLRQMTDSINLQTRLASNAEKRAQQQAAFAEEVEREKVLRDEKLLSEIKKLREAIEKMAMPKSSEAGNNIIGFLGALGSMIPRGLIQSLRGLTKIPDFFKSFKLPDAPKFITDFFTRVFDSFKGIRMPNTAKFFDDLFQGLKKINPFKDTGVTDAFKSIFKNVEDAFNKHVYNKALITFAYIGDRLDDVMSSVKDSKLYSIGEELSTSIRQVFSDFIKGFTGTKATTSALDPFAEFGPAAAKGADVAGDVSKVSGVIKYVSDFFSGIGKTIGESFKFAGQILDITPFLTTVGKVLGPISVIFSIFDGLELAFSDTKLQGILNKDKIGAVDRVSGFIGGFVGGFFDLFDLIAKLVGIQVNGRPFGEIAREFTTQASSKIFEDLGNLFSAIGAIFTSAPVRYIGSVVGDLFSVGFNASIETLSNLIKFITAIVKLDFKEIVSTGGDLVSSITTGVANIFKVVGNVLIDGMNYIIGQVNRLPGVNIGLLSRFDVSGPTTGTTSGGRQELPSGVKPSTAGGGRGSYGMTPVTAEPGVQVAGKPYTEQELKSLGLNIKQGDVQRPGAHLSSALVGLAQDVQSNIPGVVFTGFNDRYHEEKSPNSLHREGLAFDFVIPKNLATNDQYRASIAHTISSSGARVIDEYARPSAHSTGGHFHVDLKGTGVDLGSKKFGGGPAGAASRSMAPMPLPSSPPTSEFGEEDKLPLVTSGDPHLAVAEAMNSAAERASAVSGAEWVGSDLEYENLKIQRQILAEQKLTNRYAARSITAGAMIKPEVDPFTKYYQDRTESISKEFESTTTKLINATITRAAFPGGIPAGIARETEKDLRPGFLGNRISQYFDLQKKMTPTMEKLFGKQFGGQYAGIFSQAGSLILDKGANALGSMLGFDQNSPFSFQQVLGNLFTKGKGKEAKAQRKLGREQAIYSLLGIPTGASSGLSFAQKMFPSLFGNLGPGATNEQRIAELTNSAMKMFGINQSTLGSPLGSMLGMIPNPQMGGSGLFKTTTIDGLKVTQNDANVLRVQEGFTYDSWETATNQQEGFFNTLGAGLSKVFSNVGGGLADVMGSLMGGNGLGGILNWGFNLLAGLFSGSGGGTGGGMFGGGGFFSDLGKAWSGEMSWGDAILNTGMKVGGNIATNYAAYQLTKDIKNPYARLAAQQAANYVIKSGLQVGANALGYGDVASKFLGKDTGLTTALKTGDFSGLNPFSSAAGSSAGYNLAGEAGLKTGVNLTMPGGTPYNDFASGSTDAITDFGGMDIGTTSLNSIGSGAGFLGESAIDAATSGANFVDFAPGGEAASSFLGDLPGVSDVVPYAGAIVKLFQGDIKGAAISAGATYAVNAIAQYLNIGFPGLGLVAGFVVNALIGKPDPRCTWAIYVNGNSDPSAGSIISEGKKTPGSMKDATTKIGIMLFAIVKKAQITVNGPLAYDYFTISMHGKSKTSTVGVGKGEFKEKGNKEVITVSLDEISTAQGLNKVTQALVNAMLEETSAEKKSAAQSSVSKLTKSELESGVVAGAGEEFKSLDGTYYATKFEKNLNQQFNSGRSTETVSTGEDSYYTVEVIGTRQVWNEKLGKVVDEPNPLIMGYNKEGQAVDLKGNVVDFSSFSSAAGFKDDFAVRAATQGGYTSSGEDATYISPVARQVFNAKTGKFQDEDNGNIVGYDRDGKPVLLKSSTENVASPVTSGSTLTYQNLQQQNEELKNSNPSTSDASNGSTAVVNSGNVVNNNQSTIVNNTSSSKEKFFGTVSSEFSPAFAV